MARPRAIALLLTCTLLALAAGLWLGGHPASLPGPLRDVFVADDRVLRAEVVDAIEDNFYRRVDGRRLEDASLKGMVSSLDDPYSHYLTPKEARQFRDSVEGEFDGVGMTVEQDRRGLRVLNVFDGSPARRAGIRKGQLVVAVNGRSLAGVNSELATARIKGRPGTKVKLEVLDPTTRRARELTVVRRRIEIPLAELDIVSRDGRKLAVIKLASFSSGAHGFVKGQVERALRLGADGIVLDLRGNGGGLLSEAVLVSSVFVEDGEIVSVRGRARHERVEQAQGDAIDAGVPIVVLVDEGSASASEIVAGALRDRGRATVVGTRTFGKGLVQEIQPLSNGGVLDLTVANYYLPSGKTIGSAGLEPQVRAEDKPSTTRDEALPVALDTLAEQAR